MPKRIGIIGGSFDPVHNGHLIIAQDACERFDLDQALFVPAYQAPLKSKSPTATPEQRMKMLELAIAGNTGFGISDIDFRFQDTSYSIRTASTLAQEFPGSKLHWILGADQIAQLHKWRDIERLSELVAFIAFDRPDSRNSPHPELPANTIIHRAEGRVLDISSTEIRERLKSGCGAKYFLPDAVFDYIKAENLYL